LALIESIFPGTLGDCPAAIVVAIESKAYTRALLNPLSSSILHPTVIIFGPETAVNEVLCLCHAPSRIAGTTILEEVIVHSRETIPGN
jgi:hypothetical protein